MTNTKKITKKSFIEHARKRGLCLLHANIKQSIEQIEDVINNTNDELIKSDMLKVRDKIEVKSDHLIRYYNHDNEECTSYLYFTSEMTYYKHELGYLVVIHDYDNYTSATLYI